MPQSPNPPQPDGRDPVSGRHDHYADFYAGPSRARGPYGLVLGNCQAESLRIALDSEASPWLRTPPIFEMTSEDLPHLERLLEQAAFVVAQPIRADYHGLPLGTEQLRAAAQAARFVTVPSIRFAGLHPAHLVLRDPDFVHGDPPIVPYHDLRVLAEAVGAEDELPTPDADVALAVADLSQQELRRREEAARTDVIVSDLFEQPAFEQMRTINHPGNAILLPVARRIAEALGLDEAVEDLDRPLLSSIIAPKDPSAVAAFEPDGEPSSHWTVSGAAIPSEAVREAHLSWYAERPDFTRYAWSRAAGTAERWAGAAA